MSTEDCDQCEQTYLDLEIEDARSRAKLYLKGGVSLWGCISSEAILQAFYEQLQKLEQGIPIDSFEAMIARNNEFIDQWEPKTSFCKVCERIK